MTRAQGLGFREWRLRLRALGLGFKGLRALGLGLRA